MKKAGWILGFIAMALVISLPCYAKEWAMTYGGSDPTQLNRDEPRSIRQTLDGGYVVAGTKCYGCNDEDQNLWVLKLDSHGNVVWEKTYPEFGNSWGYAIQQTLSDTGYVVAGVIGSDARVLKLSPDGNVEW